MLCASVLPGKHASSILVPMLAHTLAAESCFPTTHRICCNISPLATETLKHACIAACILTSNVALKSTHNVGITKGLPLAGTIV